MTRFVKAKETRGSKNKKDAELSDTDNPLSKETFRIRLLAVSILIILSCMYILNEVRYIYFTPIFGLICLVVSGIQLWRKKKSGWVILTGLLTCISLFYLSLMTIEIIRRIKIEPIVQYDDIKSILELIGSITFWLFINNKDFREYLKINNKTRIITYLISVILIAIAFGTSQQK
jgi:hypothetical protein